MGGLSESALSDIRNTQGVCWDSDGGACIFCFLHSKACEEIRESRRRQFSLFERCQVWPLRRAHSACTANSHRHGLRNPAYAILPLSRQLGVRERICGIRSHILRLCPFVCAFSCDSRNSVDIWTLQFEPVQKNEV